MRAEFETLANQALTKANLDARVDMARKRPPWSAKEHPSTVLSPPRSPAPTDRPTCVRMHRQLLNRTQIPQTKPQAMSSSQTWKNSLPQTTRPIYIRRGGGPVVARTVSIRYPISQKSRSSCGWFSLSRFPFLHPKNLWQNLGPRLRLPSPH